MAASGFLWIGTSIGLILIYRIPHLEGIPIISGKPYLAMDGHKGAVRVLPVKTKATISRSRVGQFLSDEQRRFSLVSQPDEEEEEGGDSETLGKNATLPEGSNVLQGGGGGDRILEELEEEREEGGAGAGVLLQDVVGSINEALGSEEEDREENGNEIDDRSPTPPFLLSPPPTAENAPQVESQNNGIPADDSRPQYQPLEEEVEVRQVEQEQQVKLAIEPEEQISGHEASEEVTKATAEEEDVTPQDEVEEKDIVNGSTVAEEKLVDIEEGEKLNGDEPSYEFGEDSSGSAGKNEKIFRAVRQNGTGEVETEHLNNGHVDESGIYSAPVELDRIPRLKRAKKKEEERIFTPSLMKSFHPVSPREQWSLLAMRTHQLSMTKVCASQCVCNLCVWVRL